MNFITKTLFTIYYLILALLPTTKFVEGVEGQPSSFLPTQASSYSEKTVSTYLYRGLFKYDIYGAIVPDLAETWEVDENGLAYTIKLKDNQYWNNGKKITSDDLIYTAYKSQDLAGVATDKVDELTVRYTLPNRYAPFLSLLTVGVMPDNAEENDNPLIPTTSGDFKIARIEKNGNLVKQIVLITTDNEYEIKKIVFRYYSNQEELVTAAKLGEIDGFLSNKTVDLDRFQDHKFPLQGIYYALFFNLEDEAVTDLGLRSNLEKVLPINQITAESGISVQGPISRSLFTDRSIEFNAFEEGFRTDLGGIDLTITVPDIKEHVEIVNIIKNYWESSLDIDVKVRKVPFNSMVEKVIEPRDYQILFYGQEVGRDPDRYVVWHSTQKGSGGLNLSNFEQVRADRALEEGRNELDNEKRVVHYNDFQKTIKENVPAIFLYHPYKHYYLNKYIEGVGEKYTFTQADRFLDFFNWKRLKTN